MPDIKPEYLITAIVAIMTTIIVNLIAPIWQWRLKKKEKQHEYRTGMIAYWRTGIPIEDYGGFFDSPIYTSLRPHLREKIIAELEQNKHVNIVIGSKRSHDPKMILLDEVTRIEKETWKLV